MPFSKPPEGNRSDWKEYEKLAGKYYQDRGFEIIERNWRVGHKEIDLIARDSSQIVFVEVKSSSTRKFGHPSERINKAKRQNLIEAAQAFIQSHAIERYDLRFDVITFVDGKLEHYPDAFPAE